MIEVLACPEDKGPLVYLESEEILYNPRLRRRYPIREGIPVMLPGEASEADQEEHDRIMAKAEAESAPMTMSDGRPR